MLFKSTHKQSQPGEDGPAVQTNEETGVIPGAVVFERISRGIMWLGIAYLAFSLAR
jgi:hypothetical protein